MNEGGNTINVPSRAWSLRGIFLRETGTTGQQEGPLQRWGPWPSAQVGSAHGKYCSQTGFCPGGSLMLSFRPVEKMDLFWRSYRRTRDRTLGRSLLWFYLACLGRKLLTILSRNKIVGLKQSRLLLGWCYFWKRKRHIWGYGTIHSLGKMELSHILGIFLPNVQRAIRQSCCGWWQQQY